MFKLNFWKVVFRIAIIVNVIAAFRFLILPITYKDRNPPPIWGHSSLDIGQMFIFSDTKEGRAYWWNVMFLLEQKYGQS